MGQNLIEKIVQRHAVGLEKGQMVRAGDYVSIRPAHVMTHDNTGAVIPKFKSIGAKQIADPRQPVFALDHNIQDTSQSNLAKYAKIEEFARSMGIDFYPAGRGIGHQIMCEEGYAWPGTLAVASDSHANMYGGLGCLGTPIVRTDAAAIWATGRTWWQVPPVAKVELGGRLPEGVTGKDVIIALCGLFNNDEVLNYALEFAGSAIANLTIDERLTIANMSTEWGALAAVFPVDEVTIDWLKRRSEFVALRGPAGVPSDADGRGCHPRLNDERIEALRENVPRPDDDAFYAKTVTLDLNTLEPYVCGPDDVKTLARAADLSARRIKIDKAYLLSCVNSRVEDIAAAAAVLKGRKVADGVKFYVAAASSEVQAESEKRGDWQILLEAGAIPLPPGCGPCIGLGQGLLEDGEVGISATNRNFKGRMGSPKAKTYLASPVVVAASAIAGYIDVPEWLRRPERTEPRYGIKINPQPRGKIAPVRVIESFPAHLEGDVVFCHQDNLNTDGIYPGKYTYIDDMTPQQQAAVVMENYDPDFRDLTKPGDFLVGGFNFGTGSSREQAATALKYKGIALVIAGSFSETYKRNALNNGLLAIEAPRFVVDLKARFGTSKPTVRTGLIAKIDFANSRLFAMDKEYEIGPVGVAAQELIVAGGLEEWIRRELA